MFNDDFHRPEVETLTKQDLVGCLIVATTKSYDANFSGSFGVTQKWNGDILIVDGPLPAGRVFEDAQFMGLLAEQLGSLPPLKTGVIRITTGKTRTGNAWVGADFTQDEADIQMAKQAVATSKDQPAF
jgi:hypothetical protein